MDGMMNRWKNIIQAQSSQNLKLSLHQNNEVNLAQSQISNMKMKESLDMRLIKQNSHTKQINSSLNKPPRIKEDKNNQNSRTKSTDQKHVSNSKFNQGQVNTPNKSNIKKIDKAVERFTKNILDLLEQSQVERLRSKIRSIIEEAIESKNQFQLKQSVKIGPGDRMYQQLQMKYMQSQKERHYLKGKIQVNSKRYEALENQAERFKKVEKLLQSTYLREQQLRQQVKRTKQQKKHMEKQLEQQRQIFNKQIQQIRSLIDTLKPHLPND